MKNLLVVAYMLVATIGFSESKEGEEVLFENKDVVVTYRMKICSAVYSDLYFEYYFVEVTNKTNRKINLQYWSKPRGENPTLESFHSIIIPPNQKLTTTCDENNTDLRFFCRRVVNGQPIQKMNLSLNAFEIFKL